MATANSTSNTAIRQTPALSRLLVALSVTGAFLFALCSSAGAQQLTNVPRIAYLVPSSPSAIAARADAFRQGVRELAYVEGKNIIIEYRYADGTLERLRELAAEVVRLKVAVIVTTSSAPTRTAKEATATIPIVMAQDNDPIGNGLVASLALPLGNITGLAALDPELSGKRLELLKEIVPSSPAWPYLAIQLSRATHKC